MAKTIEVNRSHKRRKQHRQHRPLFKHFDNKSKVLFLKIPGVNEITCRTEWYCVRNDVIECRYF